MIRSAGFILVGAIAIGLAASTASADPDVEETPEAAVRIGANALTHGYVSEAVRSGLLDRRETARVERLPDAQIYRRLMAGQLDLGSVLQRPEDCGVPRFDEAFAEPPTAHTAGHVAVAVLRPHFRQLSSVSLSQLRGVLSGDIRTWQELGLEGAGDIHLLTDRNALWIACRLAGADLADRVRDGRCTIEDDPQAVIDLLSNAPVRRDEGRLALALLPMAATVKNPSSFPIIPVSREQGGRALLPATRNIHDETYPLAGTWRIVVRPGASDAAKRLARQCTPGWEAGLVNTHHVAKWVMEPARHRPVRVMCSKWSWNHALQAAEKLYRKSHPDFYVNYLSWHYEGCTPQGFDQFVHCLPGAEVDLFVYTRPLAGKKREPVLRELYGGDPPERVIGYHPLIAMVHPKNPVDSLTLDQFRHVALHGVTPWSDLGRPGDKIVTRYVFNMVMHGVVMGLFGFDDPTLGSHQVWPDKKNRWRYKEKHLAQFGRVRDMVGALAKDEDGLLLTPQGAIFERSGLKVLACAAAADDEPCLPTTENVATGRYAPRLTMRVLVHPDAKPEVREFVEWLGSVEAARAMRSAELVSPALAGLSSPGAPDAPATTPAEPPGLEGPVQGAVAVLPTKSLDAYFIMAEPAHHAAYEQVVTGGIAADGRLTLVDRTELDRVLKERTLALLGLEQPAPGAIISADVFVLPHVVRDGGRTFLRLQAIHGPTASLLGELKLPINTADPTDFGRPLPELVKAWWPSVLGQLVGVRTKPVWSLVDVAPARIDAYAPADRMTVSLRAALRGNSHVFLAEYASFGRSQREVLMSLMGLSDSDGGQFAPDADYLLDGRLVSETAVELRVLSGKDLGCVAETVIEKPTLGECTSAAAAWVTAQLARHAADRSADHAKSRSERIVRQARFQFDRYCELAEALDAFSLEAENRLQAKLAEDRKKAEEASGWSATLAAEWRKLIRRRREEFLDADRRLLDSLKRRTIRHLAHAIQLNPNLVLHDSDHEEALYELCMAINDRNPTVRHLHGDRAFFCERFAETFPDSRHHREMVLCAAGAYWKLQLACRDALRRGDTGPADYRTLRLRYLEKTIKYLRVYAERHFVGHRTDPDDRKDGDHRMRLYVRCRMIHLYLTEASDQEWEKAIAHWADTYDRYVGLTPHSDMFRLKFLAVRGDKQGYLRMLTDMQRRHPERQDKYWKQYLDANQDVYRLFDADRDHTTGHPKRNTFAYWRSGLRGIGDLPYVGYDPETDTKKPEPWDP